MQEATSLTVPLRALDVLWAQLYKNIGYSTEYERFVVVEPVCVLLGEAGSLKTLRVLDPLVCRGYRGRHAAEFIDQRRSEFLEQWLVPYIQDRQYSYILLPVEFPSEEGDVNYPARTILRSLGRERNVAGHVLGLLHYHVNEPRLSSQDLGFMTWFARPALESGAPKQIGLVVSERDPTDSFSQRQSGSKAVFIEHMRRKLLLGGVDLDARQFDGSNNHHPRVAITIDGVAPWM